MKTLCTLLLALGTICSIQAQERKVNQPPFIVRNTSTVEINQITLSDTATVLDIKAYYRPHNWIRISGESYLLADNGKKYPIRSGSGITLDKEFWMPDSGEATFSLIFPTLPATVKTIDFIESDCEDCFKIWGISLNGKLPELVLPEEVKQKTNAVEILPAPQLTMGKATLSGKLLDYKHNYQLNLNAYLCELLTGNENEIPIEIKEDGSFCTAIDLSAPTSLDLVMGREKISTLFMTPGEDTKIIINLREISRSQSKLLKQNKPEGEKLYFSGTMAQLNKTLNSKWATEWEGKDFLKEIYNMSAEEYKAYCLNKYQNRNSIIQNAKEEIVNSRNELDQEIKERRGEVQRQETRLIQKEENLERRAENYEKKEENLNKREKELEEEQQKIENLRNQELKELQKIASLSREEAKHILLKEVEKDITAEKAAIIREANQKAKDDVKKNAKELLTYAVQKCAADHSQETTVSIVALPSDEMKVRIIGREGRNIKALETLTGVDLIIDDTPEAVVLSGFDPLRREVAKIALEKLIEDGRIHPAKIEEVVEKAKQELEETIKEEGERAVLETGVIGLHPDIVKLIGKLKYRTSYGQNVLNHSIEVSNLARIMAEELGLDAKLARRAGLLHDIGKALDHDMEGTHVEIGVEILKKYKHMER